MDHLGFALALAGFAFTARLGRAETSILDPAGPRAARIAELWWVMFALGIAVFVVVIGLLLFAIFRGKRGSDTEEQGPFTGTGFVAVGGAVIPFLILMVVFGATLWALIALAEPDGPPGLTIEVAGHQFWWEVRYPDQDVVTANEIHIPVRGTNASGELGPDLTHLASRRTLAAGTLENNLGNLAGWIVDPQSIKPGNKMPATNLGSEELQALLAYLMSLD